MELRARAPAPDLDLRAAAAGDIAITQVDVLDHPFVTGQVDHARPRVVLEVVADLGMKALAVAERDLEVEELELALLDEQGQLGELALVFADVDLVVVVLAVDLALAELDPAFAIPAFVG